SVSPKAADRVEWWAIKPSAAGPTSWPAYPMVVIAGILTVGDMPGSRPPSLKKIGTMLAAPTPNKTYPKSARYIQGLITAMASPAAATMLPVSTTKLLLHRSTRLSPINRMEAIAMENAANPIPENSGDTPLTSRRKTALQSNIAPSAKKTAKHINPRNNTFPRDHGNWLRFARWADIGVNAEMAARSVRR